MQARIRTLWYTILVRRNKLKNTPRIKMYSISTPSIVWTVNSGCYRMATPRMCILYTLICPNLNHVTSENWAFSYFSFSFLSSCLKTCIRLNTTKWNGPREYFSRYLYQCGSSFGSVQHFLAKMCSAWAVKHPGVRTDAPGVKLLTDFHRVVRQHLRNVPIRWRGHDFPVFASALLSTRASYHGTFFT